MALRDIKVVEMLGLAPGPYCGMILAEFGASVTIVQKTQNIFHDAMSNGKRAISVNLKSPDGVLVVRKLCQTADVLLDTFRPGVMERLGLGPKELMKNNPKLIYARLTGYGQTGAFHQRAGHDINYLGVSGVLSLLQRDGKPPAPPINLLADFGGGSLMCAFGIVSALFERVTSQKGQLIDSNMVEGSAYLASYLFKSRNLPMWGEKPGEGLLDGGMHFYNTYETKDGKYMAIGAIEPQFYNILLAKLNLTHEDCPQYSDVQKGKELFKKIFLTKSQEEWCEIFDNTDACVTPVVTREEVQNHKHTVSRESFTNVNGNPIPKPNPVLSRTPADTLAMKPLCKLGEHTEEILTELNYTKAEIKKLKDEGHVVVYKRSNL